MTSTRDEIDLRQLRLAVNAVFDHLIEDLKIEKVPIEHSRDFYWHCDSRELFEMSHEPAGLTVGRLSDDVHFVRSIQRGQTADASYNLVHVVPLLRYIAETIGQ